jgi:hypothetical protein
MFSVDQFDQLTSHLKWKSPFHKEMSKILICGNQRIISERQVLDNVNVINSLCHGEAISITLTELMTKGFYYAQIPQKGD